MNYSLLINLAGLIVLIYILYAMQKRYISFTKRVFTALFLGVIYGLILHYVYGPNSEIIALTKDWFGIVGSGYVMLLKMIVMPLIMISITSAILKLEDIKQLGKIGGTIIFVLLFTSAIAALVGVASSLLFNLDASGIMQGSAEISRAEYLTKTLATANVSFPKKLLSVIPSNPFLDMTGARSTSTLSMVIFSAFMGIGALGIKKKKPKSFETFKDIITSLHDVIMRMVTLILRLTPFGVLALITNVLASSDFKQILKLIQFILASYTAIIVMFIIHLLLLVPFKLNPIIYLKKTASVLTFAFISRTSMGAIPMNVETQRKKLGVDSGIADLAATFGASIGQNGCAAIYPAMLAVMIAPTVGVDPLSISFIVKLVLVITISSFGVAGVGGGATFAALIVLSTLGFPVGLAGLLISIEPLIDMGRTALNVNDSILAGVVTAKVLGKLDLGVYNDPSLIDTETKSEEI